MSLCVCINVYTAQGNPEVAPCASVSRHGTGQGTLELGPWQSQTGKVIATLRCHTDEPATASMKQNISTEPHSSGSVRKKITFRSEQRAIE